MNKTININLGGYFFHIDESAYQKLQEYLNAISISLNDDSQGKKEIMVDIEVRISELLSEKITNERQVINDNQIDEIIAVMGQPEDYSDGEEKDPNTIVKDITSSIKKLFRDKENKILGGVSSGLGHYLKINKIWIRLFFAITALLGYGFGIVIYILLWLLVPAAKTTSEKLQMVGEPVNINNIEKKIRNEFDVLTEKLKHNADDLTESIANADYQKLKEQAKTNFQEITDTFGEILKVVFKIFSKVLGVILLITSGISIIALIFSAFSLGSIEVLSINGSNLNYPDFFKESVIPNWVLIISLILAAIIPMIALFIMGLRILSVNIKKLSTPTILTLIGVWLISIFAISFAGIETEVANSFKGTKITESNINYNNENPLIIKLTNDNEIYYTKNLRQKNNALEVLVNNIRMKYSNNVNININKSDTQKTYIEVLRISKGKEIKKAKDNASKIDYHFELTDNTLNLNAFFLSNINNIRKDEQVIVTVYTPVETSIYLENSTKKFINEVFNTDDIENEDMINHTLKMTELGLKCSDCNNQENTDETDNPQKKN